MIIQIPGIAYGALQRSNFSFDYPDVWKRVQEYSVTLARGRGITVHIQLLPADWRVVRKGMLAIVQMLHDKPYQERGMEGSVELQSLQVAIGRIDDGLRDAVVRSRLNGGLTAS